MAFFLQYLKWPLVEIGAPSYCQCYPVLIIHPLQLTGSTALRFTRSDEFSVFQQHFPAKVLFETAESQPEVDLWYSSPQLEY